MATKHAGIGAAFAVLTVVFGLFMLIGVILLMMWMQPGIAHSPKAQSRVELLHGSEAFSPACFVMLDPSRGGA